MQVLIRYRFSNGYLRQSRHYSASPVRDLIVTHKSRMCMKQEHQCDFAAERRDMNSRGRQPTGRSIVRTKPRSGVIWVWQISSGVAANAAKSAFSLLSGGSLCSPPAIHITPLRGLSTAYSTQESRFPILFLKLCVTIRSETGNERKSCEASEPLYPHTTIGYSRYYIRSDTNM